MVVEEPAMTDAVLNTLVVLGHRLLLVEVGGGFETHLCEATSDSAARAALDTRRALPDSLADALERGGDGAGQRRGGRQNPGRPARLLRAGFTGDAGNLAGVATRDGAGAQNWLNGRKKGAGAAVVAVAHAA